MIHFSALVVWASKQSCEAASLKKTISRTFAAAVGVEQESFVNWKAWRESLFTNRSTFLCQCFSSKMLSLETNALPRSALLGLQSIFGFQARRLESVELSQPTNAFKDFGDFGIFISIDHQDNVSLI